MSEKQLPMGGGWAAQQKAGFAKQAEIAKQQRAARTPQTEVVDQGALTVDESAGEAIEKAHGTPGVP